MVTTLATGLGIGGNGALAAKDAVLQAKEKSGRARIDFSIVYSLSEYDYQEVVDAAREATGNAPLIRASTAGEFTEEGVDKGNVTVGLLSSDDIKVFTALAGGVREDPEAAIKEVIAKRSDENARYSEFVGILDFDCAHRQLMLGGRFHESVDRFKNVLPGVPLIGWETYGDIRPEPGQFSGFHNTTAVVLLLPKGDEVT